jgi:hypothetical protein
MWVAATSGVYLFFVGALFRDLCLVSILLDIIHTLHQLGDV